MILPPRYYPNSIEIAPIIRLWLLRILVPLGGHRGFVETHSFADNNLAIALGLGYWVDSSQFDIPKFLCRSGKANHTNAEENKFDLETVKFALKKLHQQAEKDSAKATLPACLSHNISQLSELVGLSPTDCRILEFAVSIRNDRLLGDTAECLGHLSSAKVFHTLSLLLKLPESEIRTSLSAQGILARSGLVSVDRGGTCPTRAGR